MKVPGKDGALGKDLRELERRGRWGEERMDMAGERWERASVKVQGR